MELRFYQTRSRLSRCIESSPFGRSDMRSALVALVLLCKQTPPKPAFQGDFFGEMGRAFCVILKVDVDAKTVTAKLDRDGKVVTVPIKDDTELHVRDSWGELTDYYP